MRRLILALTTTAMMCSAQAQWSALAPTPFGIVMTVGQWILLDSKRLYYIEVEGQGVDAQEARLNGFRLAVEQALGTVIASETQSVNSHIRRDEVISYAAGFVDHYKIMDTVPGTPGYRVRMQVWIQRTNLAERLLAQDRTAGQIDGNRASVSIDTAEYSRSQGDRVLGTVLNDFPRRSFDIELKTTRTEITQSRVPELVIPFELRWNRRYVDSYTTALKTVSTCGWNGCETDRLTQDLLYEHLVQSQPRVLVTIQSQTGHVVYQDCLDYVALTHSNSNLAHYFVELPTTGVWLNPGMRLRSEITLPVQGLTVSDLGRVELQVVRLTECSKPMLYGRNQ